MSRSSGYPDREEAVKRFVKACQQFDRENAVAACNLNSVVSLWNDARDTEKRQGELPRHTEIFEKYENIPESVIDSVKRLLAHNRLLCDILFSGEGEDTLTFEEYQEGKRKWMADLRSIMEKF